MKNLLLASFAVASAFFFSACSKDDKDNGPKGSTHTVQYTAEGSANVEITGVTYVNAKSENESRTDMGGSNTWKSEEIKINTATVRQLVISCIESTSDFQKNGVLTVRIFVDGKQVAENTSRGDVMQATTSYVF